MGTEKSTETNDFSTDEYDSKPYTQGTNNAVVYNGGGKYKENQSYGDHNNARNHFQVSFMFGLFCHWFVFVICNVVIVALDS